MSLTQEESSDLEGLIEYITSAKPLSKAQAEQRHKQHWAETFGNMSSSGASYGESAGYLTFLNGPDPKGYLRSIQNNLARQIEIVHEALERWFLDGISPPPLYFDRIAVILRKRKELEREARFLSAVGLHFYGSVGTTWEKLSKRMDKIGVSPPPDLRPKPHHL